jgi:hypothetical protein
MAVMRIPAMPGTREFQFHIYMGYGKYLIVHVQSGLCNGNYLGFSGSCAGLFRGTQVVQNALNRLACGPPLGWPLSFPAVYRGLVNPKTLAKGCLALAEPLANRFD